MDEIIGIRGMKEIMVTCLKVLSSHWLQKAEENYEFVRSRRFLPEIEPDHSRMQVRCFVAIRTSRPIQY
jgi:hypothetical protein